LLIHLVVERIVRILNVAVLLSELEETLELIYESVEQKFFDQFQLQLYRQLVQDLLILWGCQGVILIIFPFVLEILSDSQL
jgi:hypothetical protein